MRVGLVALALLLAGCALVSPRQTLANVGDDLTVFIEGRGEVCVRVEERTGGEVLRSECELVEDPIEVGPYVAFGFDDVTIVVAVVPVDVAAMDLEVDGEAVGSDVEPVSSDMVTALLVQELPPGEGTLTVAARDRFDDPLGTLEIPLPVPGGTTTAPGTEP